MMKKTSMIAALLLVGLGATAFATGCIDDPGTSDEQPLYRWDPDDGPSSAERGTMYVNEINWAGSVADDGTYDADDVFIELVNKHPRPVNLSGWRLILEGDYEKSIRIPAVEEPIGTNEYFVIAAKEDGAFGEIADVIMEDLQLGKRAVKITLRDNDRRLIEGGGSETERPYAGGYDLVTARSMERAQILFGNRGNLDRSWHANIDDAQEDWDPESRVTIREGWRQHTMASPGQANSADYSGSTSSGTFE